MKSYSVMAVLWEDHVTLDRTSLPKNPEEVIAPTLSIGILMKETEKVIVLVHDIERYAENDDMSCIIILKSCIVSTTEYGKIKLRKLRN